ncbi:AAA family ATPase, partial [Microbispora rosea]
PELAPPRSLRPGAGSLSVRRETDVAAALSEAVRQALAQEGSVGVIAADSALPALSAALEATAVPHTVLGPDSTGDDRVLLVPATLAKGLEYDHVIVAEPAAIVEAEERGLARLYVVLTRAVTSLTVLHGRDLPEELR